MEGSRSTVYGFPTREGVPTRPTRERRLPPSAQIPDEFESYGEKFSYLCNFPKNNSEMYKAVQDHKEDFFFKAQIEAKAKWKDLYKVFQAQMEKEVYKKTDQMAMAIHAEEEIRKAQFHLENAINSFQQLEL